MPCAKGPVPPGDRLLRPRLCLGPAALGRPALPGSRGPHGPAIILRRSSHVVSLSRASLAAPLEPAAKEGPVYAQAAHTGVAGAADGTLLWASASVENDTTQRSGPLNC